MPQALKSISAYREESRLASLQGTALRDPVERMLADVIPEGTDLRRAMEKRTTPRTLRPDWRVTYVPLRVSSPGSKPRRVRRTGISDATAQWLLTTAEEVDTKGRLADGAAGTQLKQRKLDYQDGVVLVLVASIWRAFRYAHEQSPTVVLPRLGGSSGW